MPGVVFLVVLVSVVVAAVFAFQARQAAGALKSLHAAADAAKKDAELARAEQKKLDAELKTRNQQLAETREKLNDTRKRAQEGKQPKASGGRVARESELEEDLRHARDLIEQAHTAEKTARKEAQAAKAEAAAREGDVSRLQEKVRELTAQAGALPQPGAAVTTLPAAAPAEDPRIKELETARKELQARVDDLDRQTKADHVKLIEARDEIKKARGRSETNNRVYLVTKSELDLTKERLASAEKRLWESGIPLVRPETKPRPKGKGPASVDREAGEKLEGEKPPAAEAVGEPSLTAGAPVQSEAATQAPQAPIEEAPRAAIVSAPSDEVLQRIGSPKRRRPAREEQAAATPAPAESAEPKPHQ